MQKTKHICKCGKRAIVERVDTKEWFCLECAAGCIASEREQGKAVSIKEWVKGIRKIPDINYSINDNTGAIVANSGMGVANFRKVGVTQQVIASYLCEDRDCISVNGRGINDVVVAPKENGSVDLLAALVEVTPVINVYEN